jgi:hypothetical protein
MTSNITDDPIVKVDLGKNWKKALDIYEQNTTGYDSKFNVSLIGHTAHQ